MRNLQKQTASSHLSTNPFTKIDPKEEEKVDSTDTLAIATLTAKLKEQSLKEQSNNMVEDKAISTGTLGGKPDVDEDPAKVELKIPDTEKAKNDPAEKVYTKEEILPLMDALLLNGYAVTSFNLGKTTPVALKTRFAWEEQAAVKHAEQSPLTSNLGYQRELTLGLLAGSLVQFGNTVFDPINEGKREVLDNSFDERITFASGLSNVFFDILVHKMYDFDGKQKYLIDHFDELMENF